MYYYFQVLSALPPTPKRKSKLVINLAQMCHIAERTTSRRKLFPESTLDIVNTFYARDDTSRQLPGKKDFVTIRDNGVKKRIQKKSVIVSSS